MTQSVERMVPLYEAKMMDAYDHRDADVVKSITAEKRQNQPRYLTDAEKSDPSREPVPLSWVREEVIPDGVPSWLAGFSDITSATNERTILAGAMPRAGVGHTYPVFLCDRPHLVLAQLNSFVVDYLARQKVAGLHLTYTYVRQLPLLSPEFFSHSCSWDRTQTLETWVTLRVARLSCTSHAMRPMAEELLGREQVFAWDPAERALIRAELDAAFFHLFELGRDEVGYILDTFSGARRNDISEFGEYRTKRLILEVYDGMQQAMGAGMPYQSPWDHRSLG